MRHAHMHIAITQFSSQYAIDVGQQIMHLKKRYRSLSAGRRGKPKLSEPSDTKKIVTTFFIRATMISSPFFIEYSNLPVEKYTQEIP